MGNPIRIGVFFNFGKDWLGGVYYLINLINAFDFRQKHIGGEGPDFVVFYTSKSAPFMKLITYPKVELVEIGDRNIYLSYLKSWFFRRNTFIDWKIVKEDLDVIYPLFDFPVSREKHSFAKISWYPDLQHRFYPEYFGKIRWYLRDLRLKLLLKRTDKLVCSSQNVRRHFESLYAKYIPEISVLPFVSLVDLTQLPEEQIVRRKYDLIRPYFIVSNQFYPHKDHLTVAKAALKLQEEGVNFEIIMTGKLPDAQEGYIGVFHRLLEENNLNDKVRILGVVPRNDQLALLKSAEAVIQPSKFEGWSTVVEDVKAIGASIIVSDIPVHKEQLENQGLFFKVGDYLDLAAKMKAVLMGELNASTTIDYQKNIIEFTSCFESLMLLKR